MQLHANDLHPKHTLYCIGDTKMHVNTKKISLLEAFVNLNVNFLIKKFMALA